MTMDPVTVLKSSIEQPRKTAKNLRNEDREVILCGEPEQCPRCHRSIEPIFIHATVMEGLNRSQVNWRCPSPKCQELFIATYSSNFPNSYQYDLTEIEPRKGQRKSWPDCIGILSPMFVTIYDQAIEAEAMKLDQLVGMGLRKALEFLITDYVASEHPTEKEKIYKPDLSLSQRINNYIKDAKIKDCAKRAVWLGNDETHVTRRWKALDIEHLKRLIRLTVNYIDSELTSKEYIASMPESKN
ncbi:MAG: hypothetical protein VKL41_11590 [Snowella sp.]|nr:hypothetical protein [Snowella sp.]